MRDATQIARTVGADPSFINDIYIDIARVHVSAGNYDAAKQALAESLRMTRNNEPITYFWLGRTYIYEWLETREEHLLDVAFQYFETAIQFNGGVEPKYFMPDAYYYSGVIQLQKDSRDTAVRYLGVAVRFYEEMLLYKEFAPHERQRELRVHVFKSDYST